MHSGSAVLKGSAQIRRRPLGLWRRRHAFAIRVAVCFVLVTLSTIGVGLEYGFTPNWSARIEYDYLMMGNANNFYSLPAGAAALTNTISQNINMVTVGVNYKFGGPVVARY